MPVATPSPSSPSPPPADDYESRLPHGQQWFNRFAENWIFAFLIAMAVRHFVLEAFRIPTASMEPMLYGDPAFSQSDHVVVDKLLFRFTGVHRWDVTVFQFPQPEIEVNGDAQTAIDSNGNRLDRPLTKPLMYRNFVKRAVILPGDHFYIANGDIHLQQPDGSWQVSRKPPAVQEAMFQEIYRHGAQPGYVPWKASGSDAVKEQDGGLAFTLASGGEVGFDQPLRNLYVKPGLVKVQSRLGFNKPIEITEQPVSMVTPMFTYQKSQTGNLWNLDDWLIWRMTSADLDNQAHGTLLNDSMTEYVGDVRVNATVASLSGEAVLCLREGQAQSLELHLTPAGWHLDKAGAKLAGGGEAPVGRRFSLSNLDNQAILWIDGVEKHRSDIAETDPQRDRTRCDWEGAGTVVCSAFRIERDVHYCNNGFLSNATSQYIPLFSDVKEAQGKPLSGAEQQTLNREYKALQDIINVRAQMRGVAVESLSPEQRCMPWGFNPATAITAPPGAYLMMGDNSPLSWDSRNWGWVPELNLRGRALAVVLPLQRWRTVK